MTIFLNFPRRLEKKSVKISAQNLGSRKKRARNSIIKKDHNLPLRNPFDWGNGFFKKGSFFSIELAGTPLFKVRKGRGLKVEFVPIRSNLFFLPGQEKSAQTTYTERNELIDTMIKKSVCNVRIFSCGASRDNCTWSAQKVT